VRAILIVNPRATSTTPLRRDVIARALASELDLEVVQTRYRGHAARLAATAAAEGFGLVLTLGGDGTVNEAINGIMSGPAGVDQPSGTLAPPAGPGTGQVPGTGPVPGPGPAPGPESRPALAALPGGSANVFTRALGLPGDLVDATGQLLEALLHGNARQIGLGHAAGRYFAFNAGFGLDAEVVRAMEGLRADGMPASAPLYVWTAVRHFLAVTDRRQPALTVHRPGHGPEPGLFFCIVSNTAPWTFLGRRPVNPSPEADFDTGLDLFALRSLRTVPTLAVLRRMLSRYSPPRGAGVLAAHDLPSLCIRSARPIAFQMDGEYVGEVEEVSFRSVPAALRVYA
jgi:diacylglycerol kinase family enzyme